MVGKYQKLFFFFSAYKLPYFYKSTKLCIRKKNAAHSTQVSNRADMLQVDCMAQQHI